MEKENVLKTGNALLNIVIINIREDNEPDIKIISSYTNPKVARARCESLLNNKLEEVKEICSKDIWEVEGEDSGDFIWKVSSKTFKDTYICRIITSALITTKVFKNKTKKRTKRPKTSEIYLEYREVFDDSSKTFVLTKDGRCKGNGIIGSDCETITEFNFSKKIIVTSNLLAALQELLLEHDLLLDKNIKIHGRTCISEVLTKGYWNCDFAFFEEN